MGEIALDNSRADTEGDVRHKLHSEKEAVYPESAKPSVLPTSSSMLTSPDLVVLFFEDSMEDKVSTQSYSVDMLPHPFPSHYASPTRISRNLA